MINFIDKFLKYKPNDEYFYEFCFEILCELPFFKNMVDDQTLKKDEVLQPPSDLKHYCEQCINTGKKYLTKLEKDLSDFKIKSECQQKQFEEKINNNKKEFIENVLKNREDQILCKLEISCCNYVINFIKNNSIQNKTKLRGKFKKC